MIYDPEACGGEGKDFQTMGWHSLVPNEAKYLQAGYRQHFYWYAQADDGRTWPGPFGPVNTLIAAFSGCLGIGINPSYKEVGNA
ncbi:hypothetical protein ACH492_36685 [Streptomyces sp. NPDC019443]|uniref:hypothetical protein n=1 Tax=Streptomyces sp. NPDC019443 TaxID=3365061 RepID=UPI0037878A63